MVLILQVDQRQQYEFQYPPWRGFIYPYGDPAYKLYHCPITSLQSYSIVNAGKILQIAAYVGSENSIKVQLQRGVDINGNDTWERTPLQIATENNWDWVGVVLFQEDADPEIRDHQNNPPPPGIGEGGFCIPPEARQGI